MKLISVGLKLITFHTGDEEFVFLSSVFFWTLANSLFSLADQTKQLSFFKVHLHIQPSSAALW